MKERRQSKLVVSQKTKKKGSGKYSSYAANRGRTVRGGMIETYTYYKTNPFNGFSLPFYRLESPLLFASNGEEESRLKIFDSDDEYIAYVSLADKTNEEVEAIVRGVWDGLFNFRTESEVVANLSTYANVEKTFCNPSPQQVKELQEKYGDYLNRIGNSYVATKE